MELLEAREGELRRRVIGQQALHASTHGAQSIVDRIRRVNRQLEHLNATITGFTRLTEQCTEIYNENKDLLQLNRTVPTTGGDALKRAVILSSEDHISSVVSEFKKLQELQRYITQLEQIHSTSSHAQQVIEGLEVTHTQQEERALFLHARVEKLLGIYQEMISFFFLPSRCTPAERSPWSLDLYVFRSVLLDGICGLVAFVVVVYVQVLSEKCVEYSSVLDQLLPASM